MGRAIVLNIDALHELVYAIFGKAGLNPIQASAHRTGHRRSGTRRACKSYGVYRIEGVLRTTSRASPQRRLALKWR